MAISLCKTEYKEGKIIQKIVTSVLLAATLRRTKCSKWKEMPVQITADIYLCPVLGLTVGFYYRLWQEMGTSNIQFRLK